MLEVVTNLLTRSKLVNSEIYVASRPDLQDNWQMARRRTAALVVDWAISSGIVSIPIMFNLGTLPEFSASITFVQCLGHALAKDHVVLVSLVLLLTPIPIIYLRLCFRVFMHSQTPGEMLMGLVIDFRRKNSSGWMNEILYGLAQYWYIFCSCLMGTIAFYLAMMLIVGVLSLLISPWTVKSVLFFLLLLWPVCILQPLLLFHLSGSRRRFAVNADRFLDLEVQPLSRGKEFRSCYRPNRRFRYTLCFLVLL